MSPAADKLKVEWRPGIKRGGPPPGLSPAVVAEVFKTPQDRAGSVEGASPTERIVFRVTEIKVPPLDPEAADAKRIDEALRARTAEDLIAQYLARVQSDDRRHHQSERAEPGQRRRHAELTPPCRSSHRPTPSPRATSGASAGAVDHAGRRPRNAGLGVPEDRRRAADELSVRVGRGRRGARPLFGDRARSRPDLADERRAGRDQPQRASASPPASRPARSRRSRRCAR